jgi:hypothetical protein
MTRRAPDASVDSAASSVVREKEASARSESAIVALNRDPLPDQETPEEEEATPFRTPPLLVLSFPRVPHWHSDAKRTMAGSPSTTTSPPPVRSNTSPSPRTLLLAHALDSMARKGQTWEGEGWTQRSSAGHDAKAGCERSERRLPCDELLELFDEDVFCVMLADILTTCSASPPTPVPS